MIELLALALIVETVLLGAVFFVTARERSQLLDRIMARSYSEYVYATKPEDTTDTPQMTTDEIEAKWYEAQERERLTQVA